jgi:hypothetical protein
VQTEVWQWGSDYCSGKRKQTLFIQQIDAEQAEPRRRRDIRTEREQLDE